MVGAQGTDRCGALHLGSRPVPVNWPGVCSCGWLVGRMVDARPSARLVLIWSPSPWHPTLNYQVIIHSPSSAAQPGTRDGTGQDRTGQDRTNRQGSRGQGDPRCAGALPISPMASQFLAVQGASSPRTIHMASSRPFSSSLPLSLLTIHPPPSQSILRHRELWSWFLPFVFVVHITPDDIKRTEKAKPLGTYFLLWSLRCVWSGKRLSSQPQAPRLSLRYRHHLTTPPYSVRSFHLPARVAQSFSLAFPLLPLALADASLLLAC